MPISSKILWKQTPGNICDSGVKHMDDFALEKLPDSLLLQVEKAASILREGGVVAYPTDTVYGLGADVYRDGAVTRIITIKQRPFGLPLPILIADTAQLHNIALNNPIADRLMQRFWPGGLTILMYKSEEFKSVVLAGGVKIGVRVPGHPVPRAICRLLGRPLVGTSANLHDAPNTLTVDDVKGQLGGSVDFIIDSGACPGGIESTVIDVTLTPPRILRQGIIPEADIEAFLLA
jgi:L-threonylcarbamoyladenylate synthase